MGRRDSVITVKELIVQLEKVKHQDAFVRLEGCDCIGFCSGIEDGEIVLEGYDCVDLWRDIEEGQAVRTILLTRKE